MTYQTINTICVQRDTELTAAEVHGVAAGMLCVDERTESGRWLSEIFSKSVPLNEQEKRLLVNLFEETAKLLASDQMEFELFLPDDNTLLTEQVAALAGWCQGFLYGVGAVGTDINWNKKISEILTDISEFTRVDTAAEGEEDECAFVEITEYLRSAVLLLRYEINANTNTAGVVH
jgi:yecA family protein